MRTPGERSPPPRIAAAEQGSRLAAWAWPGLVAAAALAAFAATLRNGFVWDDRVQVLANPWIREPVRLAEAFGTHLVGFAPEYQTGYYRPLVHLVHACVYAVAGERAWAYHLVNVVTHALVSVGVYALASRFVAPRAAGLAALLFAVHPIHVESVAWITGIFDPALALAALAALLALTDDRPRVRALGPVAFGVALLWKETAVALAAIAVAYLASRRELRLRWREAAAYGVALGGYLVARVVALGGLAEGGKNAIQTRPAEIVLTALALVAEHARYLVLPAPLSVVHDLSVVTSPLDGRLAVGVLLAGAAIAFAWLRRDDPRVVLGLALLILPLLPTMYLPALKDSLYAERYLYLPSVGAALLVSPLLGRSRAASGAAALLAAAYVLGTVARIPAWHDEVTLWADAARKAPRSAVAWESLGTAYAVERRYAEAIEPLSRALSMNPERPDARASLALALGAVGRADEAIVHARMAVEQCRACPYPAEILGWLERSRPAPRTGRRRIAHRVRSLRS